MTMQNHPFRDGIIGLAVGDMLGAPVEFGERWMRDEDPVKGPRSGGIFELPLGAWTDDTIAAIAGGLAGLYYGYDSIPANWRSVLLQRAEIEALCAEFDAMYEIPWKGTANDP